MKKPTSIYLRSIKNLLATDTLAEILEAAKDCPTTPEGDLEFSAVQARIFERIFPHFSYQYCTTSQMRLAETGEVLGLSSVNWNLPDNVVMSYLQHAHLDDLSPLVYANPGRALNYTHVCRDELVTEHPFFLAHAHKYNVHYVISVGFLHPGHENTFLCFDFMGDESNPEWVLFDHIKIELAAFPFALAWYFRSGIFDELKLKKMYHLMSGLTENKLLNLRKYINSPMQSYPQQAEDLGIRPSTLKEDLGVIRNALIEKLDLKTVAGRNTPNRILDQHYGFLQMLGDHTQPLIQTSGSLDFLS